METIRLIRESDEGNNISLTRTTSAHDTIQARVEDIERIESINGKTRIWFNSNNDDPYFRSNFHYYEESIDDVQRKINDAQRKINNVEISW